MEESDILRAFTRDAIQQANAAIQSALKNVDWEHINFLAKEWDDMNNDRLISFVKRKEELSHALKSAGKVDPEIDAFFDWYFCVKYAEVPITIHSLQEAAKVTSFDLAEYHHYIMQAFEKPILPSKAVRQPTHARTFPSCFKDTASMERLLAAAVSVGLIAKDGDGYTWPDEGTKSHRVCALWFAAVDAGLTKDKLKNTEATAGAIRQFFRMDSLSKDTLDKMNPYNEEYKAMKADLEKNMKN